MSTCQALFSHFDQKLRSNDVLDIPEMTPRTSKMKGHFGGLATIFGLLLFAGIGNQFGAQQTNSPPSLELRGDIRQVHDPSIIKSGDTYYVFSTRAGISIRCSTDLLRW